MFIRTCDGSLLKLLACMLASAQRQPSTCCKVGIGSIQVPTQSHVLSRHPLVCELASATAAGTASISTGHLQQTKQAPIAAKSVTAVIANSPMFTCANAPQHTALAADSRGRTETAVLQPALDTLQTPQSNLQPQQQADAQHGISNIQSNCSYDTQLLALDISLLPPVSPPDAAYVQQILSSSCIPKLDRSSCPHLYYDLPSHQSNSNTAGDLQQQATCQAPLAVLQQAASLLQDNLPVAIPTETVYGLAGNALSPAAVASIFKAKGRPADNPLIVHISDLDMLYQLYPEHQAVGTNPIPQQYHKLIAAFWPGPLTILLPTSPLIPAAVTAGQPTMAVRMPAHPAARALIAAAGLPLAAPSANTSGRPSPTTAQHVLQDLHGGVPAVVDGGPCGCGVESTVLDGLRDPPVVLRPGGVTAEQLAASPEMAGLQVYSRDFTDAALESRPTTPGMKYRHYSPAAPVLLLDPSLAWQQLQERHHGDFHEHSKQQIHDQIETLMLQETQRVLQDMQGNPQRVVLLSTCGGSAGTTAAQIGWTSDSLKQLQDTTATSEASPAGAKSPSSAGAKSPAGYSHGNGCAAGSSFELLEYVLGDWKNVETVAQQLFSALRAADGVGCDVLVVQGVVPEGAGMAVMNRLQKAASKQIVLEH